MNKNINYKTDEISNFYNKNRVSWQGLYPSESKTKLKENLELPLDLLNN